jgi:hypothetical protein
MNTREIAGYDRVESAYNGQFPAVFLGKITKSKKFSFNIFPRFFMFFKPLYHVFTLKIHTHYADISINASNYRQHKLKM